jgi:hypothetical protein
LESQDGVLSSSEVEAGVLEYIYIAKERYRGAEAARGELTKADILPFLCYASFVLLCDDG